MDRLYVRGLKNVHKKLLIQAAACNLALLMRSLYGAGKPKAAHDRMIDLILTILAQQMALELAYQLEFALFREDGGLNSFQVRDVRLRHPGRK